MKLLNLILINRLHIATFQCLFVVIHIRFFFFLQAQCLLVAEKAPVNGHLSLTPLVDAYENHSRKRPAPLYGHLFRVSRVSAYDSFHCSCPIPGIPNPTNFNDDFCASPSRLYPISVSFVYLQHAITETNYL